MRNGRHKKECLPIIKDTESIGKEYEGADLPEKIHNYLKECYKRWGSGLFVLLGGDTNIVPVRQYHGSTEERKSFDHNPSDFYYADLESDWNTNRNHIYAERGVDYVRGTILCFVGRAPVENKTETTIFINKVLAYEKMNSTSIDKSYLMNHLAVYGYTVKDSSSPPLHGSGKEAIDHYLATYTKLNKWYLFDHYNCKCNQHDDKTQYSTGEELNRNSFISALNNGGNSGLNHFHIVYHMDHSHPEYMGASKKDKSEQIFISDVDELANGKHLHIIISGGCNPANFEYDCIAKHFINNSNGGAVAFIGNANNGYAYEHAQYKCFLNSIYKENIINLGMILNKLATDTNYPSDSESSTPDNLRLHLLGDPEMPVWSAVPQELDVSVTPPDITTGKNKIKVRIENLPEGEEATVCLMKDAEAYTSVVVSDTKEHSFSFTPKTGGKMKITVTARNFIPKVFNIPIKFNHANQMSISRIKNFKGRIGTGNTVDLNIVLKNTGRQTANNVIARLTTQSPYINIQNDRLAYNTIDMGSEKEINERFKVSVAPDAPEIMRNDWNSVCFYLDIINEETGTVDIDTFRVDIVSHKARIDKISRRIIDSKYAIPLAGDKIELDLSYVLLGKDIEGNKTISNRITWKAVSENPNIQNLMILNSVCSFNISENYQQGNRLPVRIRLLYDNIIHDSINFDASVLTPIADISKVKGKSTDHSISFYWSTMSHAPKYNIYRSDSENGTYTKLNKLPLKTRYYEDNGLSEYSTFYYKFSALTSSNMESELSQPIKAWTLYPMTMKKRTFTKGLYAYDSEVSVADIDLDGKKEIVLNSYNTSHNSMTDIIVLKPDGSEPYGTKDATEPCTGFAHNDVCHTALPTVADLHGNGEFSVVSFSLGTDDTGKYNAVCYSAQDKDGDGRPDRKWLQQTGVPAYRAAVVTDIDRPADTKGRKEIILLSNDRSIMIFNADGTLLRQFGENIAGHYGCPAVADLDGDGYKEIICGDGSGNIHVWRHDGSTYLRSPFFTRNGHNLMSSPVVCDLDGDGQKDIVIASRDHTSYIYAIRQDGTCIGAFDSNAASPAAIEYAGYASGEGLDHAVTVGDINGDGKLEVTALGAHKVRAWDNNGKMIFDTPVPGLFKSKEWATHLQPPLLADVDGDSKTDIVFNNGQRIYAIHADGTEMKGFPLTTTGDMIGSVCVADIDADGRNEIISADRAGYITTWKTQGTTVVWGRTRFDTGFTGEYRPGAADPTVITGNTEWQGGDSPCDIYVGKGRLLVSKGRILDLDNFSRIIVTEGATLEIDGGEIKDADILIKAGGTLRIKNNGTVRIAKYGRLDSEPGAIMEIYGGEVK
nr:C25 family cysteine peptidase [Xylanibacter muris]